LVKVLTRGKETGSEVCRYRILVGRESRKRKKKPARLRNESLAMGREKESHASPISFTKKGGREKRGLVVNDNPWVSTRVRGKT